MCSPLISIIMPSFNSERTIQQSIQSVIDQTYSNWELLITDDCSVDSTAEIIQGFSQADQRIKLYRSPSNQGAGAARNNSILNSTGKYIAFLDADDVWFADKLEKQIRFMEEGGVLFSYTSYQHFSDGNLGGIIYAPDSVTSRRLLYGNVIGCLTVMFNAEVLGRQLMPLIRKRQDLGLWLVLMRQCHIAYGLPEVLALYRTDSGMTKNKFDAAKYQWQFYREIMGFGIVSSAWYFFWYSINGFLKHIR